MNYIIERSISTKLKFTKDFKEKKSTKLSRAVLNFGHSFGHAIENLNAYKNSIKHGEAVSLGMIIELKLSEILNFKPNSLERLENLIIKFNLPTDYSLYLSKINLSKLIDKIKLDKKSFSEYTNLALINKNNGFIHEISFDQLKKLTLKLLQ